MSSRRAVLLLFVSLVVHSTNGNDNVDSNETTKRKINNLQMLAGMLDEHGTTRGFESSTFNPDVLNKFLEEYANKIKYTTEESFKLHPYPDTTTQVTPQSGDKTQSYDFSTSDDKHVKPTETYHTQSSDYSSLNDTNQRNKYNNMNSQDDRNGWVALDAIPWSKSKISKWQSSPSTQNPWPDSWDNPNTIKPWNRPKPMNDYPTRPSYNQDGPAYTQKWPPESAPWDNRPYRPNIEIITDNRPSNFPNNWDRNQMPKPNYPWNRFPGHNNNNFQDWNNYPPKYEHLENSASNHHPDFNRRPFPQYQYDHNPPPPPQPGNGEGQWILLSTNRGYTKTRQRSIQINTSNGNNVTDSAINSSAPVVSTRRQVRLTVLPSLNGVNTTISHGGLLEVENTFKTVDQSQKEYEQSKMLKVPTIIRNKLFNNAMIGKPSKAAVLAAVGAGMLPVTMAMMIPMMLGRRKRSLKDDYDFKRY